MAQDIATLATTQVHHRDQKPASRSTKQLRLYALYSKILYKNLTIH